MSNSNSRQIGGDHYASKAVQPWDAMQSWMTKDAFAGYLLGNCIKYLARYKDKNGVQDLQKCEHYLAKLIEVETVKAVTDHTTDNDDDKVGYGKPPKHTRFQVGKSGNPKGRPKGKTNSSRIIDMEGKLNSMAEDILKFQLGREAAIYGLWRDERYSDDWLEGYDQVKAEDND